MTENRGLQGDIGLEDLNINLDYTLGLENTEYSLPMRLQLENNQGSFLARRRLQAENNEGESDDPRERLEEENNDNKSKYNTRQTKKIITALDNIPKENKYQNTRLEVAIQTMPKSKSINYIDYTKEYIYLTHIDSNIHNEPKNYKEALKCISTIKDLWFISMKTELDELTA